MQDIPVTLYNSSGKGDVQKPLLIYSKALISVLITQFIVIGLKREKYAWYVVWRTNTIIRQMGGLAVWP